jgi:hypothetical protein
MSVVTAFPRHLREAAAWFRHKLSLKPTARMSTARCATAGDFVLLHVVGSEETFARRHLPGALHFRIA